MVSKPVVDDYRATPYLICRDSAAAIDWYREAFAATEVVRMADPSGKVMHVAKETMAVADQFDGERRGPLVDPFGHRWLLATRVEDVSFSEISARFRKMMSGEA